MEQAPTDKVKSYEEMTRDEKVTLAKNLSALATECGFQLDVELYSENVAQLFGETPKFIGKSLLRAKKELPSVDEAKANAFNEKVKPMIDGITGISVNVVSKLGAGDMYKPIGNVMPFEGEEAKEIVHNEGEVILVDFWATWCPPCQKPMAHNQEMLQKRKSDWGDKVRIIGVSIDQSKEQMVEHVNNKGWTAVEHYHRHKSDCSEVYGVQGVPHVLLLDTKGRIVFKGHPATRKDLEADFDTLLKGEPLTGEGAWVEGAAPADAGKDAEEDNEGYKELDSAQVEEEVVNFKAACDRLIADKDLMEKAKGMARNFCVITVEEKYDTNSDKMLTRYTNHRVIVGSQELTDVFKLKFDEEIKGCFEKKEQVHVIPSQ